MKLLYSVIASAALLCSFTSTSALVHHNNHGHGKHHAYTGYSPEATIAGNVLSNPDLSVLASVVTSEAYSSIATVLSSPGPYTLFAPSNAALIAAGLDLTQVDAVLATLQFHVISGSVPSTALTALQFPSTLLSSDSGFVNLGVRGNAVLEVTKDDTKGVQISFGIPGLNTSTVTTADIASSNGYIHIIDTLLSLPALSSTTAVVGGLNKLVAAVQATGLVKAIDTTPGVTILAPLDGAFEAAYLNGADVTDILESHVFPAVVFSSDLKDGQVLTSLSGKKVTVTFNQGVVLVNGAQIIFTNILTANGVVHLIDQVLFAPNNRLNIVQNALLVPSLSTLVSVVSLPAYAPILKALSAPGTLTLFAPNNAAFAVAGLDLNDVDTITNTLLYHVLPATVPSSALGPLQFPGTLLTDTNFTNTGSAAVLEVAKTATGVTVTFGIPGVNTATVVLADIISSNGVIHVVDKVLLTPAITSATANTAGLSALVNAVVSTGLANAVDTLSGITIFAPTNDAFAKAKLVYSLSDTLLYHVVPAVAYSTQLKNGQVIGTDLTGKEIIVSIVNGEVKLNGNAKVVVANVITKNGVVHVIDTVLTPPQNAHHKKHYRHFA